MITISGVNSAGEAFFADLYVAAEEYYSIDCTDYLTNENDSLVAVTWTVPDGLTELDSQINGNIASIKLRGDTEGTHYIGFSLDSTESGNNQDTREKIKIKVLPFV